MQCNPPWYTHIVYHNVERPTCKNNSLRFWVYVLKIGCRNVEVTYNTVKTARYIVNLLWKRENTIPSDFGHMC